MRYFAAFLVAAALILLPSCNESDEADDVLIPELKISAYVYDESIDRYLLDEIAPGKVYRLAEVGYLDMININLLVEFDGGVCQVISDDENIQLSVGSNDGPWVNIGESHERMYGYSLHMGSGDYISLRPLGVNHGALNRAKQPGALPFNGYDGYEYYFTVNAYELANENSPVISARLRLTQLGDENTDSFSIELISYEMSETYAMELAS